MPFDRGNLAAAKMQDRNQSATAKQTHYPTGSSHLLECAHRIRHRQWVLPSMGSTGDRQRTRNAESAAPSAHYLSFLTFAFFLFCPTPPLSTILTGNRMWRKGLRECWKDFRATSTKEKHFTQRDCKVNSYDNEKAMFRTTFRGVWKEQCTYEVPTDPPVLLHENPKAPRGVHTRPFVSLEDNCPHKTHP